jgi:hypothetical protein
VDVFAADERGVFPCRVWAAGDAALYYAPFDYVNTAARIVLVGITPSRAETVLACRVAQQALARGLSRDCGLRLVKDEASFPGSLRRHLVAMLDGIGIPSALGTASTPALFAPAACGLLHATAILRYPLLVKGRNYTGWSPPLLASGELREFGEALLAAELRQTKGALVVPLGSLVSSVLERFVEKGWLRREDCLLGFPHPSGANARRARVYAERQASLAGVVIAWATRRDRADLARPPGGLGQS